MKLVVGFVTYNDFSAKYLALFLPSLEKALLFLNRADFRIMMYDNSEELNNKNFSIINTYNISSNNLIDYSTINVNLGFGRAYNFLINKAVSLEAEYFLLLNPDMLLEEGAVKKLVEVLDVDKSLTALSPKIYYWDFLNRQKTKMIDSLGLVMKPGLRFFDLGQGTIDRGQFDNFEIIGPSGAAALFRVKDLKGVAFANQRGQKQYFDEKFFMYKEDCDLAYRLHLAKLKSKTVIDSIMYHDRSSGSNIQGFLKKILNRFRKSRQIRAWSLKNQNLLYFKYWKNQNFVNKLSIIFWFSSSFIFSLILEQYNLKVYFKKE